MMQEERVLGEALQQTEESGIAALEERLARRGESSSLAEAESALTSLLHKLSLKSVRLLHNVPPAESVIRPAAQACPHISAASSPCPSCTFSHSNCSAFLLMCILLERSLEPVSVLLRALCPHVAPNQPSLRSACPPTDMLEPTLKPVKYLSHASRSLRPHAPS